MRLSLTRVITLAIMLPSAYQAFAAEPTDPSQSSLRFVAGTQSASWPVSEAVSNDPSTIRPTFAALFPLAMPKWDVHSLIADALRKPDVLQGLSEQQQAFLKQQIDVFDQSRHGAHGTVRRKGKEVYYNDIVLFAVSEEDARGETLAVLSCLEHGAQIELQKMQKDLAEKDAALAEVEQKISQANAQKADIAKALNERAEKVGYEQTLDELRQSLRDAQTQLRSLVIEQEGQRVRAREIQHHMQQELDRVQQASTSQPAASSRPVIPVNRELLMNLQTMLVQLDIDIEAATARRGMLQMQIEQDKADYSLRMKSRHLNEELIDQQRTRSSLQSQIADARKHRTEFQEEMSRPQVLDNVVYIIRLESKEPATQPASAN